MLYAKHHPGTINARFVIAGNTTSLRTGIVSTNKFISNALDVDTGFVMAPLGTRNYTVILSCTAYSVLGTLGGSITTKPAGF